MRRNSSTRHVRSTGVVDIGRFKERGVQSVSCTILARCHILEMYDTSVGFASASELSVSGCRSSIRTSVCVAVGGRARRTVKKVSWKKIACHSLRRVCFSHRLAFGHMWEGSRFKPRA